MMEKLTPCEEHKRGKIQEQIRKSDTSADNVPENTQNPVYSDEHVESMPE